MTAETYDLAIIGGGINGAGIARDAAGRGLRVLLCEERDIGAATSSASTKLVHGGLRYLEHFAFRLVREALNEREVLLRIAPHIVRPMRFVLPHALEFRPSWTIRLGLMLYDRLGGGHALARSETVALSAHPAGRALAAASGRGYVYSDCCVDDSRLVLINAMSAADKGAVIRPRTRCEAARRQDGHWFLSLRRTGGGEIELVRARALVNATGPWVSDTVRNVLSLGPGRAARLVKGSHFVVPRLFEHDFAYVFQNHDRRIVFAIPYEGDFTLIGTTEVEYRGDPGRAQVTDGEVDYLCAAVNRYFGTPVDRGKIVWSFAGVRPLYDDGSGNPSSVTRDYHLDIDRSHGEAPVLSVFGGKITTYRKLAERALGMLRPTLGFTTGPWTGDDPLPGGDFKGRRPEDLARALCTGRDWLSLPVAERYMRTYGTRAQVLLENIDDLEGLGHDYGGGLYEAELRYLRDREWAATAEDMLWRRTKLGLRLDAAGRAQVEAWVRDHGPAATRRGLSRSPRPVSPPDHR